MVLRTNPARRTRPVGVIDIGSNSIRLVVYTDQGRVHQPIFNEKVLCGLGRGIDRTNRLPEDGVQLAIQNLVRFSALSKAMNVRRLRVVATAAVREAENGPDFVSAIRKKAGLRIEVLDGEEEARLSGLGVVSGMPDADGFMGDLGGGSLELVAIRNTKLGRHTTLPFGALRLREIADRGRSALRDHLDKHLEPLDWLSEAKGRSFYAVGGAWRALARLHMAHVNYPLKVIHGYELTRDRAEDFLDLIAGLSRESLERIGRVPRKRLEVLPFAALVLHRVLQRTKPSRLVFTALGLREGCLYDEMPAALRRIDPLIAACDEMASANARFPVEGRDLLKWTAPLFTKSAATQERLRLAACLLGDIAWSEHPDYRGEIAYERTLHMPLTGLDHRARAFIALAVYTRYTGSPEGEITRAAWQLLHEDDLRDAYRLGLAMRLAFTLSGGAPQMLRNVRLERKGSDLRLLLKPRAAAALGEAVERRFQALAEALGGKGKIRIGS